MNTKGTVKAVYFQSIPTVAGLMAGRARRRFWLAAYSLPSRNVLDSMYFAAKRGIDVRMVVSAATCDKLPGYRINYPAKRVQTESGTMHSKFAVADDEVLIGSSNFGEASGAKNAAIVFEGYAVRHFSAEFKRLQKLPEGEDLLRGEEALKIIVEAAQRTRWTSFLTKVHKRVAARGWITPRERYAVENAR